MDVVKRHWKDAVTKNVIINTIGNYISFIIGALYTYCLFRFFSPYDFGILSILLTISYLLANMLNFGIPATLYAHIPTLSSDREKTFTFLKTNFLFQTLLASIALCGVYVILPLVDIHLFKVDLPRYYYALTMINTLLFIWQNFVRDALNAAQKFLHINTAINLSNIIKTAVLIWLGITGQLTIPLALVTLGIIGSFIIFLCVLLERRWIVRSLIDHRIDRIYINFNFTMPYFLSTQLFNLTTRADLFLIAFFLTPVDVGYYSVAQRVIFVVITSIDSITQVLSPEFTKVSTRTGTMNLIKKALYYVSMPSLILLAIFLTPEAIYRLIIPAAYQASIPLIKLLSLTYIPFAFDAVILLFFLYTLKKSSFVLYINIVMLAAVNIFHLLFIPRIGIQGPVVSFGITYLLVTLLVVTALMRELRLLKH